METSLTSFKAQFRESLMAFLWSQWSALGVSGHARTRSDWLIDPEALLLFSTVAARHDVRLFDEILDWIQLNADAFNLQRLGRLQKEFALGDASILAAIATQLTHAKAHPKWRRVAAGVPRPDSSTTGRPLFPHLPATAHADELWLAWNWRRPSVELRGLSQTPRPDRPATFLFKLRALFGLQTRAEVMAWLLAHESGHPAEIARATGYFRGSIQSVLNELADSGHVYALRIGREKHFGLRRDEWRFLLTWPNAKNFPHWLPWPAILALLQRINELLDHPKLATMSPAVQAIEFERALAHAAQTLTLAGFWPPAPSGMVGETSLQSAIDQVHELLARFQNE